MSLEEIERDLTALKPLIKLRHVTVVGGEPTLHPELLEVLRLIKRIRIDEQTMLVTNGSRLKHFTDDIWREIEKVRLSVYPKLDKDVPEFLEEKRKEFGFEAEVYGCDEFFLQMDAVPDGSSFHDCPWKTDCFTVHKGHFFLCPQSTFMPKTLMNLPEFSDGLPLAGLTEDSLLSFMNRKEPLNACRNCRGYGAKVPWSETRGREEWIKSSTIP